MEQATPSVTPDLPSLGRCFCHYALDELFRWAQKKYHGRMTTMELLALAKDRREKEAVSIVALLDLPDDEVLQILSPLTPAGCRILACRDHVKRWLADMLDMRRVLQGAAP